MNAKELCRVNLPEGETNQDFIPDKEITQCEQKTGRRLHAKIRKKSKFFNEFYETNSLFKSHVEEDDRYIPLHQREEDDP